MHDSHPVQVVNGVQDLPDQRACVFLRVESFFHDSVEQLAARHPAGQDKGCMWEEEDLTHTNTHTAASGSRLGGFAGLIFLVIHEQYSFPAKSLWKW